MSNSVSEMPIFGGFGVIFFCGGRDILTFGGALLNYSQTGYCVNVNVNEWNPFSKLGHSRLKKRRRTRQHRKTLWHYGCPSHNLLRRLTVTHDHDNKRDKGMQE